MCNDPCEDVEKGGWDSRDPDPPFSVKFRFINCLSEITKKRALILLQPLPPPHTVQNFPSDPTGKIFWICCVSFF